MLLVDQCRYTLLGIEKNINYAAERIGDNTCALTARDLSKVFLEKKYNLLIISSDCLAMSNYSAMVTEVISRNIDVNVIVLSAMNWPSAKRPLKIFKNIYLASRVDLALILDCYRRAYIEKYLKAGDSFYCSTQEDKVLSMIINQYTTNTICQKLKITNKTLSSHLTNVRRKACARSNQQIIHAYMIKRVFLNL
ncbi:LuxR C-terminal-related transcriptional regulator [Enterobacter sp. DRP3]|nr:LuxR C-terminal-related transcriptional regulator [Enterobacter sp. DRP3]